MQVISLFSGIGGFEVAASQLGWETVVSCEINPFCQRILKYHFPKTYIHSDIHTLNHDIIKEKTNWDPNKPTIIVGGFPCQPYSTAGKRLGKEDDRHLWPEMLRIISEIKPAYVVGENVRGIISWNEGLVFEEVHADLEAQGYKVRAYVLPAAGVGAPHRRDRVWFVACHTEYNGSFTSEIRGGESQPQVEAWEDPFGEFTGANSIQPSTATNPNSNGHESGGFGENRQAPGKSLGEEDKWEWLWSNTWGIGKSGFITDTNNPRNTSLRSGFNRNGQKKSSKREHSQPKSGRSRNTRIASNTSSTESQRSKEIGERGGERETRLTQLVRSFRPTWEEFPTQPPVCGGDDGLPTELDSITFSKWRTEAIKALGNAIVPQVALQIFKSIQQNDTGTN